MTESELLTAVNAYFSAHLDSAYWSSLDPGVKQAAVTMASNDVLSLLPGADIAKMTAQSAAVKAIAEQAVYLVRNYESISEGKVLTSESVEGISAGYTMIGATFGISNRAEVFIKRAAREFSGNSARICRG